MRNVKAAVIHRDPYCPDLARLFSPYAAHE
jgi:hypothetical protein